MIDVLTEPGGATESFLYPAADPGFDVVEHAKKDLKSIGLENLSVKIWNYNDFKLEYLDKGFYGHVYKATCRNSQKALVLKELNTDFDFEGNLKLFYEEISLLSTLTHPNVIKFLGITFNPDRIICYLSEFIDGGSLYDMLGKLEEFHLSWDTYLNIALDLARGMVYLHNQGVIHRDLTSKNVLLRQLSFRRYQAIIIDFGLCYQNSTGAMEDDDAPVGPSGTPWYIAPELFKMQPCSKKTDVFSYGIILCEIAAGIPGADPDELPRNKKFGLNVEKFSELSYDCPVEFLNLAVRCCQMEAKLRPAFTDIVKMIDIILDNYEEEHDELLSGKNTDQHPSSSSYISTDDFFVDKTLLCHCMKESKLTRSVTCSGINKIRLRTVYNRFGGLERAGSRKQLRKHVKRCSTCGGRLMAFETPSKLPYRVLEEQGHAASLPSVVNDNDKSGQTSPEENTNNRLQEVDLSRDHVQLNENESVEAFTIENGMCFENESSASDCLSSVTNVAELKLSLVENDPSIETNGLRQTLVEGDPVTIKFKTVVENHSSGSEHELSLVENDKSESENKDLLNSIEKRDEVSTIVEPSNDVMLASSLPDNPSSLVDPKDAPSSLLASKLEPDLPNISVAAHTDEGMLYKNESDQNSIVETKEESSAVFSIGTTPAVKEKELLSDTSSQTSIYTAAVLLGHDKQNLSSKTSLLLHNTPGRLPKFFQQMLRHRKTQYQVQKTDDKKKLRSSMQKLFHKSTSGTYLTTSASQSSAKNNEDIFQCSEDGHDSRGRTNQRNSGLFTLRRRSQVRNETNDYSHHRRSMPVFKKSWFIKSDSSSVNLKPNQSSPGGLAIQESYKQRRESDAKDSLQSSSSLSSQKLSPTLHSTSDKAYKKRSRSLADILFRRKSSSTNQ